MRRSSSLQGVNDLLERKFSSNKFEDISLLGEHVNDLLTIADAINNGLVGGTTTNDGTYKYTAGFDVSGHCPVSLYDGTHVKVSDGNDLNLCKTFIGVAANSASVGDLVNVVRLGHIQHSGWDWLVGEAIYIGDGVLTQVEPVGSVIAVIGYASDSTTVVVKPQPIILKG